MSFKINDSERIGFAHVKAPNQFPPVEDRPRFSFDLYGNKVEVPVYNNQGLPLTHVTVAYIIEGKHPNTKVHNYAVASCSYTDKFDRKLGRKVALGRLLLENFTDKRERERLWLEYFTSINMTITRRPKE